MSLIQHRYWFTVEVCVSHTAQLLCLLWRSVSLIYHKFCVHSWRRYKRHCISAAQLLCSMLNSVSLIQHSCFFTVEVSVSHTTQLLFSLWRFEYLIQHNLCVHSGGYCIAYSTIGVFSVSHTAHLLSLFNIQRFFRV